MEDEKPIAFGKAALKHFSFEPGWRNLNHGSFGSPPNAVKQKLRAYQDAYDSKPDEFIRYEYPALLDKSRTAAAELLSAPEESIVLVHNATVAINTVLRNLKWNEDGGDVILSFSTVYEACAKMADFVVDYFEGKVAHEEIQLQYPVEDSDIILSFRQAVEAIKAQKKRVRMCIFDVVSSRPGVVFPWQSMIQACKELGVLSMVDGAQGVGMLPIDLSQQDPDFFVTNCHKWLHTPRGCAIFYIPVRNQHLLRSTLSTSHGYVPQTKMRNSPLPPSAKSQFVNNFEYVGTLDNSQYLCLPDALEWRRRCGGEEKIMEYLWDLSKRGAGLVAEKLGTEVMNNKEGTLTNCAMANVALPVWVNTARDEGPDVVVVTAQDADNVVQWMTETLVRKHRSFLPFFIHGGRYWVRISAQVYLDMDDYAWAASVLQDVCSSVCNVFEGARPGTEKAADVLPGGIDRED